MKFPATIDVITELRQKSGATIFLLESFYTIDQEIIDSNGYSIHQTGLMLNGDKERVRQKCREARLKNDHSIVITNHADGNQKSTLITKIDRKASMMRGFSKEDDSETLDGSYSLVTSHLDKTLFGGKKDNHLGTSNGFVID